jgi:hypothetical protein
MARKPGFQLRLFSLQCGDRTSWRNPVVIDGISDSVDHSKEGNAHEDGENIESWTSPFEQWLVERSEVGPEIKVADPIFGEPHGPGTGKQESDDTCAIRCEEYVIEQFTGHPVSEAMLVAESRDHGWYRPGEATGLFGDVGNLLELHGIKVNRYVEANIFHLANELAQGHKIIIGVDSEELAHQNPILHDLQENHGLKLADHTVVVSGVDTTHPEEVKVMVSDPANGEPAARYSMPQFLHAWEASAFFMVTTQEPAPPHLPEMANFDYGAGHIPYVGDMPYEEFVQLEHRPEAWEHLVHHDISSHAAVDEVRHERTEHAAHHDAHPYTLDSHHQSGSVDDHGLHVHLPTDRDHHDPRDHHESPDHWLADRDPHDLVDHNESPDHRLADPDHHDLPDHHESPDHREPPDHWLADRDQHDPPDYHGLQDHIHASYDESSLDHEDATDDSDGIDSSNWGS